MSTRIEPQLLEDLKAYGKVDVEACFNCGNCTAICPLSENDATFPRRMIRMAQVGLRDDLLSSKELWLCYYCGECTDTCPRQAAPGEFMAAARGYAISHYDSLGLGKLLHRRPFWAVVFMIILGIVLAGFMYTRHGTMPYDTLGLFEFIPAELIHNIGVTAMVFVALAGLWGLVNMLRHEVQRSGLRLGVRYNWWQALIDTIFREVLGQKRYREDCDRDPDAPPWYLKKWFIHASTMWGFLGLLAATSLDFATALLGIKETGAWVPIYSPIRLLGTISGLFLIYGTTVSIIKRLTKADRSTEYSTVDDWAFLIMMWLSGMTGFAVEVAIYLPPPQMWAYWMLLVHIVIAMEMLLLIPFTKFAHIFYRTMALYLHALKPIPEKTPEPVPAGTD
ncbi:MAG: 4Fe-4S dicluster domain-containing protein [Anaerolineae bacterium]|nr:4Fe-4S dicluster domain-containing protein [Anaerolineae bacterium]